MTLQDWIVAGVGVVFASIAYVAAICLYALLLGWALRLDDRWLARLAERMTPSRERLMALRDRLSQAGKDGER